MKELTEVTIENESKDILGDEEGFRPSNIDDYEYAMFGKIFRITESKGSELFFYLFLISEQ